MFKVYKDVVFAIIVAVWVAFNTYAYMYWESRTFFSNNIMLILMCILILCKLYMPRFNNWLNTHIGSSHRRH